MGVPISGAAEHAAGLSSADSQPDVVRHDDAEVTVEMQAAG
jgi:hypothetical protein